MHSDADAVWVRNPFPLLAYAEVHAPGRAPSNRGAAAALSARQHKLMSRASLVRLLTKVRVGLDFFAVPTIAGHRICVDVTASVDIVAFNETGGVARSPPSSLACVHGLPCCSRFLSSQSFERTSRKKALQTIISRMYELTCGLTNCLLNFGAPQVLAMLPTFLGNLQEYGDDQRSWNMAMDTMGRLSWQGNPLLEANEDELLVCRGFCSACAIICL